MSRFEDLTQSLETLGRRGYKQSEFVLTESPIITRGRLPPGQASVDQQADEISQATQENRAFKGRDTVRNDRDRMLASDDQAVDQRASNR